MKEKTANELITRCFRIQQKFVEEKKYELYETSKFPNKKWLFYRVWTQDW